MIIGIVGSEAAKFTPLTEARARAIIRTLLGPPEVTGVSSGACHLGGIDIYAEEEAGRMGKLDRALIFPPKRRTWEGGYKQRNLAIVSASDEVHCITLGALPEGYTGMRFDGCYHCGTTDHVKSGGCWTVKMARRAGKRGVLHVLR